jgi:23S rRNA (guanine2445-N2)-methyltransferase / 23S rRNA (guanine2069-N7)-methyltransferase
VLARAGWPELARHGGEFLDPMCGSGTLVIEAALIAAGCAPGLTRSYFGFLGWRGHDEALWRRVRDAAAVRCQGRGAPAVVIRGQDIDPGAVRAARENAARAGVAGWVRFEARPLSQAAPARTASASGTASGLLCTNPPYGVRLQDRDSARELHRELGAVLRERFKGWQAAVLTGAPELGMELGLRAARTHTLWNGPIECRLLRITVEPTSVRRPGTLARVDPRLREAPGARMFANRLSKNVKRLQSWAKRAGVSCYRLYDADMPEYAFAIDLYRTVEPEESWLYVQEYAAPASIEQEAARRRRGEALAVLTEVTGVAPERIRLRTRRRARGGEQYAKAGASAAFHTVLEGGLRLLVNFDDYLDTGLFLDHRLTRARLRERAGGARFLNLFAYTGTATVYAAAGGAAASTSVDLSRTYLDWAQRNLALNVRAREAHGFVQADCREWLREPRRERFDLIFLDPPTFSNSKRMAGVLDIARDHPALIDACARLLSAGGLLVFSTNARGFRLDPSLGERFEVLDVSAATLPRDFERNPRIHRCFELRTR